ncbi:MAG: hypothetical protein EXQ71_08935 [Acidimicrobiia bacterium]|nr:hypothetical protein [Acidimicrobiia bacterium]
MTTNILLAVLILTLVLSAVIAVMIVRRGRARAMENLSALPGVLQRSMAATSLGVASLGSNEARGTGTLVLTNDEVAFAQWRPEYLLRIPRAQIIQVDTTRTHLERTMKHDVLRLRWTDATTGAEDTFAAFVRDLDPWLSDLGGQRSPHDAD